MSINDASQELSKCCEATLFPDLDPEKSHSWQDVADATLVCEVCGKSNEED